MNPTSAKAFAFCQQRAEGLQPKAGTRAGTGQATGGRPSSAARRRGTALGPGSSPGVKKLPLILLSESYLLLQQGDIFTGIICKRYHDYMAGHKKERLAITPDDA